MNGPHCPVGSDNATKLGAWLTARVVFGHGPKQPFALLQGLARNHSRGCDGDVLLDAAVASLYRGPVA